MRQFWTAIGGLSLGVIVVGLFCAYTTPGTKYPVVTTIFTWAIIWGILGLMIGIVGRGFSKPSSFKQTQASIPVATQYDIDDMPSEITEENTKRAGYSPLGILILACLIILCIGAFAMSGYINQISVKTQQPPTDLVRPTQPPTQTIDQKLILLSCDECAEAGMDINLWEKPGDIRGKVTGAVPNNTWVMVTDKRIVDGIVFYQVDASGISGWVRDIFVASTSQVVQPTDAQQPSVLSTNQPSQTPARHGSGQKASPTP